MVRLMWAYETFVVWPIMTLYRQGPLALGFGGGTPSADVCARLTGVQAQFWSHSQQNSQECESLIEREVAAWILLAGAVLYWYAVVRGLGHTVDGVARLCFVPFQKLTGGGVSGGHGKGVA